MASDQQNRGQKVRRAAIWGIPAIALVCCALPVILVAIGFTAAGAFMLGHRYWLFGGMLLVMGVVMFIMSRQGRKSGVDSCGIVPVKDNKTKSQD